MSTMLFGVNALDWVTYLAVAVGPRRHRDDRELPAGDARGQNRPGYRAAL